MKAKSIVRIEGSERKTRCVNCILELFISKKKQESNKRHTLTLLAGIFSPCFAGRGVAEWPSLLQASPVILILVDQCFSPKKERINLD